MTTFEPGPASTDLDVDRLEVVDEEDGAVGCVICGAPCDEPGCCSFTCVREARRELDHNLVRLRGLHGHDGPAATRARLTERNGRLTAALMVWRQ